MALFITENSFFIVSCFVTNYLLWFNIYCYAIKTPLLSLNIILLTHLDSIREFVEIIISVIQDRLIWKQRTACSNTMEREQNWMLDTRNILKWKIKMSQKQVY